MGTLKTTGRVVPYAAGITGILTALEELEDDRLGESREKNIADLWSSWWFALGTVIGGGLGALTGPAAPIAGFRQRRRWFIPWRHRWSCCWRWPLQHVQRSKEEQADAIKRQLEMGLRRDALMMIKDIQRMEADDALQRANEANFYNTANQPCD